MNELSKFRTKKGELSRYAFACGYVQEKETEGVITRFYHDGGACYHVRTHDHNAHTHLAWDVAENITAALKIYRDHIKKYHGAKK